MLKDKSCSINDNLLTKPESLSFSKRIKKEYSSSFIVVKCLSSILAGAIMILGFVVRI